MSFLTRRKAKARILALDTLIEAQTEARNKLTHERQYIRDTGRLDWPWARPAQPRPDVREVMKQQHCR